MAFAGDFLAAANLVPFGLIASRQHGAASSYDANGNIQFTTAGGTVFTPGRVDDLLITGASDILLALADDTNDGSAADTGVLVTAAAGANQHGLPANFGPGRGGWAGAGTNSRDRLICEIRQAHNDVAAITNAGAPVVRICGDTIANGQTSIVIKNMSEVELESAQLRIRLDHSIQP